MSPGLRSVLAAVGGRADGTGVARGIEPGVVLGSGSIIGFRRVRNVLVPPRGVPGGTRLVDRVVGVCQPPSQPVEPPAGGTAKAAEAITTSITAMNAATVANDKMRFIRASPFTKGGALSLRCASAVRRPGYLLQASSLGGP
jgi:hypothetical protein